MKYIESSATVIDIADPLKKIEYIGRLCYNSRDKIGPDTAAPFVERLLKRGHLSVLRHAWFITKDTWMPHKCKYLYDEVNRTYGNAQAWYEYIGGYRVWESSVFDVYINAPTVEVVVPEFVATQFVRHSTLSFSVMSDRYVKRDEVEIVRLDASAPIDARYEDCWRLSERNYLDLVVHGVPAQEARRVLPNAVSKRMAITGDMPAWEHFFKLRCAADADPMARDAANKIKALEPFKELV